MSEADGGADQGGAGEGEKPAEGGAAALLADGGDAGGGKEGGEGGGDGGSGADWFADLGDEDRAWAQNKNYADKGTLVKSFRELEARFLAGDKLVVPKEGDPQEAFDRYYAALGRPEAPDKYQITAPEGHELDKGLVNRVTERAFKAGMPDSMLQPVVEEFNTWLLEEMQAEEAKKVKEREVGVADLRKEWGDNFNSRVGEANRAMKMLELSTDDIGALEDAWGTTRTMKLLHKLGAGMGEDALIGGGAAVKFSVSPSEAKVELDRIESDPAMIARYRTDKSLRERADMLRKVIAAADEARRAA